MVRGGSNLLFNSIKPLERGFKRSEIGSMQSVLVRPLTQQIDVLAKQLLTQVDAQNRAQTSAETFSSKHYFQQQLPLAKQALGAPQFVMQVRPVFIAKKGFSSTSKVDLGITRYHQQFVDSLCQFEALVALSENQTRYVAIIQDLKSAIENLRWELDSTQRDNYKAKAYHAVMNLFKMLRHEFATRQNLLDDSIALNSLHQAKQSALDALAML